MWQLGNINTTPEGFGFLGLLYGQQRGLLEPARFKLPEYDRLYEQARALPDGPSARGRARRMSELVTAYAPWVLHAFRYENVLVQPWVQRLQVQPDRTSIRGDTSTSIHAHARRRATAAP